MKLVVGLGNPGAKYADTRHNVGFWVLRRLSERFGGGKPKRKFDAEVVEVSLGGEQLLLLAPATFMNASGRAVAQAVRFFDLDLAALLVICDDLNLPLGRIRLRRCGSAGGQKGLADIIARLGTDEFARLRIGIDPAPEHGDAADYVLSPFRRDERPLAEEAVATAADAVEVWAREGIEAAMNQFNASSPPPSARQG